MGDFEQNLYLKQQTLESHDISIYFTFNQLYMHTIKHSYVHNAVQY